MSSDAPAVHRIAFYADTNYKSTTPPTWIPPEFLDVEAIILGGDIHYSPEQLSGMLRRMRETQHPSTQIVVVPGNGEYIDYEFEVARAEYRRAVESVPNAVFLDDDTAVLPSGLRVIGSTLWSHLTDRQIEVFTKRLASYGMRGVDNIQRDGRYLTFEDTNELHARARSFIEGQLRSLSPEERATTVVCTHYWPTGRPWAGWPGDSEVDRADATADLDDLIEECGPSLWLSGHWHVTKHVTIGSTRISSNPRAGESADGMNHDFSEAFILEVPDRESAPESVG
jgi:Icc-related predicted phosphoesterase